MCETAHPPHLSIELRHSGEGASPCRTSLAASSSPGGGCATLAAAAATGAAGVSSLPGSGASCLGHAPYQVFKARIVEVLSRGGIFTVREIADALSLGRDHPPQDAKRSISNAVSRLRGDGFAIEHVRGYRLVRDRTASVRTLTGKSARRDAKRNTR